MNKKEHPLTPFIGEVVVAGHRKYIRILDVFNGINIVTARLYKLEAEFIKTCPIMSEVSIKGVIDRATKAKQISPVHVVNAFYNK